MKSGPNQHYVPVFVQKAFGIPPKRREVWYFERDKQPEKRAIKRTGSQDHFYADPTNEAVSTLDDEITKIEGTLSQILHSIRSAPIGGSVNPCNAASIVAHLASRTAHVRNSLKHVVPKLLDRVKVFFADADNLQAFGGLDQTAPNDRFRERLFPGLSERPEITDLNLPAHVIERVVFYLAKENAPEFLETRLPLFQPILERLLTSAEKLVRDGHNKALAKTPNSNPLETFLGTLNWTKQIVPGPAAILPDCIVIAITNKDEAASLTLLGQDDIRAVLLPVSPKQLLVGITDGYTVPLTFDYNLEAARSQLFSLVMQ